MKKKKQKLKSSNSLKFIMPKNDKRESPRMKIMTQTLTVGQARQLAAKVNKFIALAS